MRVWSAARSCYIDGESLNFTGPLAAISLIPGEGREQRYADLLSSRGGSKYGDLPTCTEAGTRNRQKGVKHGDKTCACGSRMHWRSTRCRACATRIRKRAFGRSIPEPKRCGCGRTIAKSSRLARCVKCRELARRIRR